MVKYTAGIAFILTSLVGLSYNANPQAKVIANDTTNTTAAAAAAAAADDSTAVEQMTATEEEQEKKQMEDLLREALIQNNAQVVAAILETHPDLANSRDANGWTKLHDAVRFGNPEIVKLLVERGKANIFASHDGGESVLDVAMTFLESEDHEVVIYLKKKQLEKEDVEYDELLYEALTRKRVDIIAEILEEKPHLANWRDTNGWTKLHNAVRLGNLDVIKILVEDGNADIYARNGIHRDEDSVLTVALEYLGSADHEVVRYLENRKQEDARYQNLLQEAVQKENNDVLAAIMEEKPHLVHLQDHNGWNKLHEAVRVGNIDAVKLLVEKGNADVNSRIGKDHDGLSVMDIALEFLGSEDHEVVRYLKNQGSITNDRQEERFQEELLREALLHENAAVVADVLEAMPEVVHSRDPNGWTNLHQAVRLGNLDTVKLLVEKGNADVHARHGAGHSVMDVAMKYLGSTEHEVVRYLENLVSTA